MYTTFFNGRWDYAKRRRAIKVISFVLGVFNKSFDNFIALISDNCSSNQSIAIKFEKSLLGCASHRSQLSVLEIISEDEEVVRMAHTLMIKLRTLLLRAKLWHHTPLRAKLHNESRCTYAYIMLERQAALCEAVAKIDDKGLDEILLSATIERRRVTWLSKLSKLNEVVLKLQSNDCTLRQARAYFDSVLDV